MSSYSIALQRQAFDAYNGSPMGVATLLRKSSSTLREEKHFKVTYHLTRCLIF